MTLECEHCGEMENVVRFRHFDTNTDEFLCWEHRWPIIERRLHPERFEERGATIKRGQPEVVGQSSLADFV